MKKSKDITKYDIDWQVKRVSFKKLKTYQEKCEAAKAFLLEKDNAADRERVLNYLEGLSMAYRGHDREYILNFMNDLSKVKVSDDNRHSMDLSKYTDKELKATAKDNLQRCIKYLKNGYRHQGLIEFLKKIYEHLDDKESLKTLNDHIKDSMYVENKHKYFF